MKIRYFRIALFPLPLALLSGLVCAQISDNVVRIGVIADMAGPYSAHGGPGVVRAVELAVKDFGGKVRGKPIEIISADYQNKVDIASSKVREWYDRDKVDVVIESTDSAAAIAMQKIAAEKKRPIIFAGSGTTVLTNKECSPYGIHYTYDTYSMATAVAKAVVAGGGSSWYFITLDQAFGHTIEKDATKAIEGSGGKVLGSLRHPLGTGDFGSFLLQAQASKAKVIALANAGKDTQNALRQAAEFGITKGQTIVPMLIYDTDIKGLGLAVAQGIQFTTAFYWDRNKETRDWSNRFFEVQKTMPTQIHAGAYSAALHYLRSVEAAGTDSPDAVIKQMKATPINDMFAMNGKIRVDGRMVHDMYLAVAKKPADSKGEWDLIDIKRTIPGEEAFQSLSAGTCSLATQ